jgi:hypothetical protein
VVKGVYKRMASKLDRNKKTVELNLFWGEKPNPQKHGLF